MNAPKAFRQLVFVVIAIGTSNLLAQPTNELPGIGVSSRSQSDDGWSTRYHTYHQLHFSGFPKYSVVSGGTMYIGRLYVEKNNGSRVIADLTLALGADPDDKQESGYSALCYGEEQARIYYYAAKKANLSKIQLSNMKSMIDEDIVSTCKKHGGAIIPSANGEATTEIGKVEHTRVRSATSSGFGSLVPVLRTCLFYKASVKCDMTQRKDAIKIAVTINKESLKADIAEGAKNGGRMRFGANKNYLDELADIEKLESDLSNE